MTAQTNVICKPYRHRGAWRLTWRTRAGALRFARVHVGIQTDEGRYLQIQQFDGQLSKLGPMLETTITAKLGAGGTLPKAVIRQAMRGSH